MTGEQIPPGVRLLIIESIDSVAQLEAILLLRTDPTCEWTAAALAKRLYIGESAAATVLADLKARGFAAVEPGPDSALHYRYSPASPALGQLVDELADTYRKQLIPVTNLIHSKPSRYIQRFADAFRLRKDG